MTGSIRHIVMWRVRGDTPQDRTVARHKVKAAFEGLLGRIDGLTSVEVGLDVSAVDYACDVVLVTEFESRAALKAYADHPEHLRVRRELGDLRVARFQVDYVPSPMPSGRRPATGLADLPTFPPASGAGAASSLFEGERMIETFTYDALPIRVRFGRGTRAEAGAELHRLGGRRALVLTTPQQAAEGEALGAVIGEAYAGLFAGATMHTPVDVTEQALETLRAAKADCVVALGGGSTTGLGKALALRTGVPQLVIPTTYAGSEMTPILGETANGRKTTIRSLDVLPEAVIYDVDLTLSLPPALSATSGVNAIAHSVEALYAKDRNPVISLMAEDSIRALSSALPILVHEPANLEARTKALYGAWLAGCCLGAVGMALHHKLCHTLGGTFDLPHAETHTIVLPHALAYNAPAAPEAVAAITRALGAPDAAQGLFDLVRALGVPRALSQIGMPADGIERAADLAMENPYWNPRPVTRDGVRDLIARAYAGERPMAAAETEEAA